MKSSWMLDRYLSLFIITVMLCSCGCESNKTNAILESDPKGYGLIVSVGFSEIDPDTYPNASTIGYNGSYNSISKILRKEGYDFNF